MLRVCWPWGGGVRWALSLFLRFFRYPSLKALKAQYRTAEPSCGKSQSSSIQTKLVSWLVLISSKDYPTLLELKHPNT